MKNLKTIISVASLLCILVFLLTIADFLALHDIRNDYVSKKVLSSVTVDLPEWTNTTLEWQVVTISFVTRFFFFIFNIGVLLLILRKIGKLKQQQAAEII